MGKKETATQRLNLAQAFNPMGSLLGMFVAKEMILAKLDSADAATRRALGEGDPAAFATIQRSDLGVISGPYIVLGMVVVAVLLVFLFTRLPRTPGEEDTVLNLGPTFRRLARNRRYVEG